MTVAAKLLPLLVIPLLAFSLLAQTAEAQRGVLQGQVVNKTQGGSGVADLEVTLYSYLSDQQTAVATTQTDAQGKFQFQDLPTDPDYSYQVTVNVQEVLYQSERAGFEAGETTKTIEITAYDTTTNDEEVKIELYLLVVSLEEDHLLVAELFRFINQGDRTYIGSQGVGPGEGRETLRFSLPPGATELQYTRGILENDVLKTNGTLAYTGEVKPGGKEIGFAYQLPFSSPEHLLTKVTNYPTNSFVLLIQGGTIRAESQQLVSHGLIDVQDTQYLYLSGEGLPRSFPVEITLLGLPLPSHQETLRWIALGAGILVFGFALSYSIRNRGGASAAPEEERRGLLQELAQLDDDFEGDRISPEDYQRARQEKKGRLMRLMRHREE